MQSKHLLAGVVALCLLGLGAFLAIRRATPPAPIAAVVATPQPAAATPPAAPAITAPTFGHTFPVTPAASARPAPAARFSVAAIPAGTALYRELAQLSPEARARAITALDRMTCGIEDANSLHVDAAGALYYTCDRRIPPTEATLQTANPSADVSASFPEVGATAQLAVPASQPPVRHSRPGATAVLYLDFNGHRITGTAWNTATDTRPAVATYDCPPYDTDGDPTTFSDQEQADIIQVWERVAEDYAPFAVDVTTEEPPVFGPRTARALITSSTDRNGTAMPSFEAGGVAYLDVFGSANFATYYSPALAYYDRLRFRPEYIAEAVSHEVGHNLGLHHDGISGGDEYYGGHGSGETSWGPLMGTGYNRNVTQWSKGEYAAANNTEDDVQLIGTRTGFAPDDVGDLTTSATALPVVDFTFSTSGLIGTSSDTDLYSFTKAAGACSFSATPYRAGFGTNGGNADLVLTLLDSAGTPLATSEPETITAAEITTAVLPAGTYFLKVGGGGSGAPLEQPPSGYTGYGSLGRYTLAGKLPNPLQPIITGPGSGSGTFGVALELWITVDRPVISYQATGLPTGLSVDAATGRISGVPQQAGTFPVTVSATSATGSAQAVITLTIAGAPPFFTSQPAPRTVLGRGESITLGASAVGASYSTYYSLYRSGRFISSGSQPVFQITATDYSASGWYQIVASDSYGASSSGTAFVCVAPAASELRHFGAYPQPEPAATADLIEIAAGRSHALALRRDGTVVSWGDNTAGQLEPPAGLTGVVAVAAGDYHSIALRADGTVAVWGRRAPSSTGTPAELAPPASVANIVAVAARADNCMALRADGSVVVWGLSASGIQPPTGQGKVRAISLGRNHAAVLFRTDNTKYAETWGDNTLGQTTLPWISPIPRLLVAGDRVTIGVDDSGFPVPCNTGPAPACLGSYATISGPVRALALSDTHRVTLFEIGTVAAWSGDVSAATAWTGIEEENCIWKIAAGDRYTLLLRDPADFQPVTPSSNPADQTFFPGGFVRLCAVFSGSYPIRYRWQAAPPDSTTWTDLADGPLYQGATNYILDQQTIPYQQKGWRFRCVASNGPGATAVSTPATLTASLGSGRIGSLDVWGGSGNNFLTSPGCDISLPAFFGVDQPDLQYRWQVAPPDSADWTDLVDGEHYRGTTSRTLTVAKPPLELSGSQYRCIASAPFCQPATTGTALLIVERAWSRFQGRYFSASDLTDPAIAGEAADPDGDGIPNLLEYAFGLDPRVNQAGVFIQMTPVGPGLQLSYAPASTATDLIYTLQSSTDLRTWTDVPEGSPAANEAISFTVAGNTATFYRVAVQFR